MARIGHYRSACKPKITVVDRQVSRQWRQALGAHPALEQWVRVEKEEARIEDVGNSEIDKWLSDECAITMVYVCTKDEIANLRIARLLVGALRVHG